MLQSSGELGHSGVVRKMGGVGGSDMATPEKKCGKRSWVEPVLSRVYKLYSNLMLCLESLEVSEHTGHVFQHVEC